MHREYSRIVPGAKTAVLMVHGIVGTPRHFDFLLDLIPVDVSVVNILLEGHGGTVTDFAHASMKKWKAQVARHMDCLCQSHERVILVAHSMGTLLTAEAAEKFPQVGGMVYLNVPLKVWVAPKMVPSSLRWCFGKLRPGHAGDEGLKAAASAAPDWRLWRYLGWLPRFWELLVLCRQSRPRFEKLEIPSYVFQSRNDELVRRSAVRHLANNPNIQYTMLPGCGHFSYTDEAKVQIRSAFAQLLDSE